MRVDAFDFTLPEELIALRPARPRDAARLLVVRENGVREHCMMRDLPALLRTGDALVVNDTKVIAARLRGVRMRSERGGTGAQIEVLLLRPTASDTFRALARPVKRLKGGDRLIFDALSAEVVARREGGEVDLRFDRTGAELLRMIDTEGETPLPPYIAGRRAADAFDVEDYQTTYAARPGSAAAPTAGLHFTPELLSALTKRGIHRHAVTLHVGSGTFLPVTVDDTRDHRMHPEWAELSAGTAAALNAARPAGGRIVAVGSTALRTLETAAAEPAPGAAGILHPFSGETALFIVPGYHFKAVDVLLTNFHLPRSTLFMLVCAFAGTGAMKAAYAEAIAERYRFYSYGDACLLFRKRQGV